MKPVNHAPSAPAAKSLAHRSLDGIATWLCIAALAAAAAWFAHSWSEGVGYTRLADGAVHQLDLYAANLNSELSKYESLPSFLELDENLFELLGNPDDAPQQQRVNKALLNLSVRAGTLAILVLDERGVVRASSDWFEPHSLLGSDLSRAAFHAEAMRNGQARAFVADASRGTPECYFARAILRGGRVVGVVAVKVSLESIESAWTEYAAGTQGQALLVIDENEVVIMSSYPAWRYKSAATLPSGQRPPAGPAASYPPGTLQPLGMRVERELPFGTQLVHLTGDQRPASESQFVAQEQLMPHYGWRLMTLSSVALVRREARDSAIGAAGLAGLVGVLFLYMRQRRRTVAHQLAAREALQQAKNELELRVEERTAELSDANAALVTEIAERRRTEAVLREAQNELIEAGRLALLGQMSAAITHEINQPLTALRALSDNGLRLLKVARLNDVERNLKSITELTERMGRITAQLKSFARKAAPPTGTVRLGGAVANALKLLQSRIVAEDVTVQVEVPGCLRVSCDGHRLEQVLLNLVGNGLDAMRESPTKRLRICATVDAAQNRVRLRVSDTGPGLPDTVMARLFEPFFSTKPPGEGLGLGLVISSGIVREFGSTLRASNSAEGAVFEFDMRFETEAHHA